MEALGRAVQPSQGPRPRLHRAAGGMATHLAETGESPETGGRESGPRVLGIAHHGTISVSVLENIIAPRAPRSSPAPDRLPARRSLRCGAGAPWPPARGLRRLWGPGAASWCQSALIVKPNSETQPAPASPLHPPLSLCRAPWPVGVSALARAWALVLGLALLQEGLEKGIVCTVAFDTSHHCHVLRTASHRDRRLRDRRLRDGPRPPSLCPM